MCIHKTTTMKHTYLLMAVIVAGVLQAFTDGDRSTSASTAMNTERVRAAAVATDPSATADTAFAKEAAMGGMMEVELGKMAAERAANTMVKSFGKRMVADHGKANEQLKSIAHAKNIDLPTHLNAKHQEMKDKLGKLSGNEFDKAYVDAMLMDHKEDLEMMQKEAKEGKDADLRAFAAKTASVIQKHLTMIQQIPEGMK